MNRILAAAFFYLAASCGQESISSLDEAWNQQNDPQLMGYDHLKQKYQYKTKFSELPLSASLSTLPWSGDYWATYRGGITYRWNGTDKPWQDLSKEEMEPLYSYDLDIKSKEDLKNIDLKTLSPAEKFDIYNNDFNFTLTRYERQRTQIMKTVKGNDKFDPDFEIPSWEGLCHAWAPATLNYKAPKDVVIKNDAGIKVPFGASDIKALLTYKVHLNQARDQTKFLGQRCNLDVADLAEKLENGEITQEQYRDDYRKKLSTSACKDTNAGAFHLTLANQIGHMDEGFVVDVTRDAEVWNQGVYKYETVVLQERDKTAPTAAPGTVRTILVSTYMYYVNEVDFSWNGEVASYDNPEGVKEYYYYLELNDQDEIIGGEWVGMDEFYEKLSNYPDEKDDRPDFMWKMERKPFTGFFAPLQKVYRKSTAHLAK